MVCDNLHDLKGTKQNCKTDRSEMRKGNVQRCVTHVSLVFSALYVFYRHT